MLSTSRPRVRGKFLSLGETRYLIRGVTYGPFPRNSEGHLVPEKEVIRQDFALMREYGINTIRTYIDPPPYLLDLAADADIRVIVGVAWLLSRNCIYDDAASLRNALAAVRQTVTSTRGHPAVLMYCIGNEIPPLTVRWHGKRRVEAFLRDLCTEAKTLDPDCLITYANHPPTEYLETDFVDVVSFNVYLEDEAKYLKYLKWLQVLAGPKPLFLAEVGVDARRNTEQLQASWLQWTIEGALSSGLCGTVIFSWTDEWSERGFAVSDWQFGITDASRSPRPAASVVRRLYSSTLADLDGQQWPKVSVIVVTYNGSATLRRCLESLTQMTYPNYEVIVVDDGSTDNTREIAAAFDGVKLVSTRNQGLSAGRNVGLEHATGEIVAYTDDDCFAEQDWLFHIVDVFRKGDYSAAGGSNLPPLDEGKVAQCVAAAPGAPNHVLLTPEEADHIPGCNMAFRTDVLREIGGFNPFFVTAGDDVDVCWRLHDRNYKIGFAPAAVVWHRRRSRIAAYLKQQRGYGEAEGRLELEHPDRFNSLGYATWRGVGAERREARLPLLGPVIYHGPFCSSGFQSLYERHIGLVAYLPEMIETYAGVFVLVVLGLTLSSWLLLPAGVLAALVVVKCCRAGAAACRNRNLPAGERFERGALVALLHFLQPIARGWGRTRFVLRHPEILSRRLRRIGWSLRAWCRLHRQFMPEGTAEVVYHPCTMAEREDFLKGLIESLHYHGMKTDLPCGWEGWDIRVRRHGLLRTEILTAIEDVERDGVKLSQTLRVRVSTRVRPAAYGILVLLAAAAALAAFWGPCYGMDAGGMACLAVLGLFALGLCLDKAFLQGCLVAIADQVVRSLGKERIPSAEELLQRWFAKSNGS